MFNRQFLLAGTAGILVFGLAQPAMPQEAADSSADVITILGEKIERSLQDTPTSVAVTTAERIGNENIRTLFDIVNRTANVGETYGPTEFTIRGIASHNVSGGGTGGLASIYVDGVAVPDGVTGTSAGPFNMWDVEQVEILRGPQSTLQGRNSLAGAIVVQSRAPTWDWDARARLSATDQDDVTLSFAGGGPIVEDQVAFRIAIENREFDGIVGNPTRGGTVDGVSNLHARARLLIEPEAVPGLSVLGSYTHYEQESGYPYTYIRTDTPDFFDNRINTSDAPNSNDSTTDMVTLNIDYALADRVVLTSLTAWSLVDAYLQYDNDLSAQPAAYGDTDNETETLTQEFRLDYSGDRLTGLVGLYLSDREVDNASSSLTLVNTPETTLVGVLQGPPFGLDAATAAFAAGLYVSALPQIAVSYGSQAPSSIETSALFADGRFELTPRLTLLGGFRYDRETYTITSDQTAVFAGTYPDPALYGPYAPVIAGLNQVVDLFVAQAGASAPTDSRDFEAFLPKLGLTYNWTDDLSTSAIVQRGYRSGGSTVNIARSTVVPYDPEYTWNYEFSLRSLWLDGDLSVNANAYYIDWTDQQVWVNLGLNDFDTQTENAGSSHLYGFELEVAHRISRGFDWYASLGHTKTEFDDFVIVNGSSTDDLSGSEFAYAPAWTLAAGANWTWSNGLFANLNGSHRSEEYTVTGVSQAGSEVAARTLVNGSVGYEQDSWAVSLFVNNLFDEDYFQYRRSNLPYAILGQPRVVGVTLETNW